MNKHHRSATKKLASAKPAATVEEGIRHRVRLKIDSAGRVLIPADIRQAMGIDEGSIVLAWLERQTAPL